MSLPIAHIAPVIARLDVALDGWHDTTKAPLALHHRDREWTRGGERVVLSIWDSVLMASVTVEYWYAGAQVAHLVLSSVDQILPWLRVVGAVVPVPLEVAAALLTPDASELPALLTDTTEVSAA